MTVHVSTSIQLNTADGYVSTSIQLDTADGDVSFVGIACIPQKVVVNLRVNFWDYASIVLTATQARDLAAVLLAEAARADAYNGEVGEL